MKQKAVSLILSAATIGWKSLKDVGKGVNALFAEN
jgi:hypothetical protein